MNPCLIAKVEETQNHPMSSDVTCCDEGLSGFSQATAQLKILLRMEGHVHLKVSYLSFLIEYQLLQA